MLSIIDEHDTSRPLYLHYASRHAHVPLQASSRYTEMYAQVSHQARGIYMAMVTMADDIIYQVTQKLKEREMWQRTLMLFTSDNGGFVQQGSACSPPLKPRYGRVDIESAYATTCMSESGASNWPLRGGKYSYFEGGIRVNSFISGGYLPTAMRGTHIKKNILHIADWYSTFSRLANVHEFDYKGNTSTIQRSMGKVNVPNYRGPRAEDKIVPPVDSLDLWPMLSRGEPSPRREIFISSGAYVYERWKFFKYLSTTVGNAIGGPTYPNETSDSDPVGRRTFTCTTFPGCLFDVVDDAGEHEDVCATQQDTCAAVHDMLKKANDSKFLAYRTYNRTQCRLRSDEMYGGYIGPVKGCTI
eukprot:6211860-Pleurochrysis_carterae.AAC.1